MSNTTSSDSNITQDAATTSSSSSSILTTSKPTSSPPTPSDLSSTTTKTTNVAPTTVPAATPTTPPPSPQPPPALSSTSSSKVTPNTPITTPTSPQDQQPQPTQENTTLPTETPPAAPADSTDRTTRESPKSTLAPSFVTVTLKPTSPGEPTVVTVIQTSTHVSSSGSGSTASSSSSPSSMAESHSESQGVSSGGLTGSGKIAIVVITPILAVTLFVLGVLFIFRRRKQRKHAEELRRKEVEEYGYNPNQDPTFPVIGSINGDNLHETREGDAGYRGWGATAPDAGRKPSTTISGNSYTAIAEIGMAYSEGESPTHGTLSDTKSDNALIPDQNPSGIKQDLMNNLGSGVTGKKFSEINRETSNASSSYSAANLSDESGEMTEYYNGSYKPKNYEIETPYDATAGLAEMAAHPVIRNVQARRNTRIESPSHFPQQSSGISQNF